MDKNFVWNDSFGGRQLEVVTMCPMGVGTCILLKMVMTKVFGELDIPVNISVASESQPPTDHVDLVVLEGLRADEIRTHIPDAQFLVVHDIAKRDVIKENLLEVMKQAGWIS